MMIEKANFQIDRMRCWPLPPLFVKLKHENIDDLSHGRKHGLIGLNIEQLVNWDVILFTVAVAGREGGVWTLGGSVYFAVCWIWEERCQVANNEGSGPKRGSHCG